MPCYDPRDNVRIEREVVNGVDPEELTEANRHNQYLTAIICALVNELERRHILDSVILAASEAGKINIVNHIRQHLGEDRARMMNMLGRLSDDELSLVREILRGD